MDSKTVQMWLVNRIAIAGVIGGQTNGADIDSQPGVVMNRVAAN